MNLPSRTERDDPNPVGVYVHLPWCVRKCPYCDFNSHPLHGELPAAEYIAALRRDFDHWSGRLAGREVSTVYFGGGTPSLFSGRQIASILQGISEVATLAEGAEITLEANPGTIERDSFAAYRDAGVNRVSLGVQSFDERALQKLGRIHGRADIERSIASLRDAGLENYNIDLMYGLPGQTLAAAVEDLRLALTAAPAHLSHYNLTLEPNTAFAHDPPELPDHDACSEMQEACGDLLAARGWRQYEVSAWARPGRQCAHNLNYWRYGDFVGIGAGAHGKLSGPAAGEVRRWSMPRQPRVYLAGQGPAEEHLLGPEERIFEYFLNRLRLRERFSAVDFCNRTGLSWSQVAERVEAGIDRGLLAADSGVYGTSELGWRFLNDTQQIFLP